MDGIEATDGRGLARPVMRFDGGGAMAGTAAFLGWRLRAIVFNGKDIG